MSRLPPFAALLGLVAAGLLLAPRALAQIPPIQWQLLGQGSVDIEADNPGGEVQANLGLMGIGLAVGLGGEALRRAEGGLEGGGFLDLALQFRPAMLAATIREDFSPVYAVFDPHLDAGGLLGAISEDGRATFRGVFYVGAVLDFAIPLRAFRLDSQLLITVGYRLTPVQTQDGSWHHLVFGLGFRGGL